MIYHIYAVHDLDGGFGYPVVEENDNLAIRGFTHFVNTEPAISNFREKIDFWELGTYDTEHGVIDSNLVPELVVTAVEVFDPDYNKKGAFNVTSPTESK